MKLVSVNCGLPREVIWHGESVTTSIYKDPVEGRVALRTLNLDGDRQADLSVHGGKDKAVYCYPIEHHDYWKTSRGAGGETGEFRAIQRKFYDELHDLQKPDIDSPLPFS